MNGFVRYLRVQLKRSLRIYPIIIGFTLILSLCVVLVLGAMITEDSSDEKNLRVKVGLVGDIEDTHLGIGISVVQEIDTSKYYVEFVPLDEAEAKKKLDNAELLGYISVPDDFVDSIVHGENKHLTYIAPGSSSGLGPLLVREIIGIVSDLLTESQNGIYGMAELSEKYDIEYSRLHDAMEELNIIYFESIFSREDSHDIRVLGTGKGMGFADYYFSAFTLVLMLLWGMICVPMLTKRDLSLERLMASRGRGAITQVTAEYIPFFLVMLADLMILLLGAGLFLKDIDGAGFTEQFLCVKGILYMLAPLVLITAMQFFLYEISNSVITAVLVQMFSALAMSYASGFFYPSGSLPEIVQRVAELTPTGAAFGYLSDIFAGGVSPISLTQVLGYALLLIAASVGVRSYRIRRVQI